MTHSGVQTSVLDRSTTVTVAAYDNYPDAQRAVDVLSDHRFPVDRVAIVGNDVHLVEQAVGRTTVARAALAGAGTGAWIGLLIGLLLGLFAVDGWWAILLTGAALGGVWGAVFGAIAHATTGGRRDIASVSALRASEYTVVVDADHAEQAIRVLENAPGARRHHRTHGRERWRNER
jgi:hypothetical protein